MKVFAFDRDQTVSISNGPVPLGWIKKLKKEHKVWAIGNQKLRKEAGIPGKWDLNIKRRRDALRKLKEKFPRVEKRIVVDDRNLSDMEEEGWKYYSPREFVKEWREKIREM